MGMPSAAALQAGLARLVGRPLFWVIFVFALFALPIGRSLARTLPPAPPVLGEVQPFELDDQDGHRMGSEHLKNHVWVATFLRSDAGADDAGVKTARDVLHRARNLGDAFRMVTFAADATQDSESARHALVQKYCSSAKLWTYLGGTPAEVDRASHALLASVGAGPSNQLLLVDGRGRIRGLYGSDKASIDHLMDDVGYVVNLP